MNIPRRRHSPTSPALRRGHMRGFPYRARNTAAYIRGRASGVRGYVRRVAHVRNTLRASPRAMTYLRRMGQRARHRVALRRRPALPARSM